MWSFPAFQLTLQRSQGGAESGFESSTAWSQQMSSLGPASSFCQSVTSLPALYRHWEGTACPRRAQAGGLACLEDSRWGSWDHFQNWVKAAFVRGKSEKANMLICMCQPGVSPGAMASDHLYRVTNSMDAKETVFLLSTSAKRGTMGAVPIQLLHTF